MAVKKKTVLENEKNVSSDKLDVLITIVNRKKGEYFTDLIQSFNVNFQFQVLGQGTASEQLKSLMGFSSSEKLVIFSVIPHSNVKLAISTLEEKFKSIRDGKGIAFTVSLSSVIGRSVYGFLSNNKNTIKEEA